jgi:transcriptional regulator with XRE-family HTH domain
MEELTVQERLIALRKSLKLNQVEFAKKLGVTQPSVSALELGKMALTEQNIKLLSFIFGVSEQWLRAGSGAMYLDNSAEIKELLEIFDRLSSASRKMVLELARTVLANQPTEPAP